MVMNQTTSSESELAEKASRQGEEEEEEELVVTCDCCGLTEECTQTYITMIRQRYQGRWICGLCQEAVGYEMRFFNTEEAFIHHMSFCNQFKSSVQPPNPAVDLISAMRHILRRSASPGKHGRLKQSEISEAALETSSQPHQNHQDINSTSASSRH
nr:PREDICTED: uncharacterized protein LOC108222441 [Daucus carota subsp. sativus]